MANDRLFLVCPRCGEHFMLAKHYGDAWSTRPHGDKTLEQQLDEFFEKHWTCELVGDAYEFWLMNEHQLLQYTEAKDASLR